MLATAIMIPTMLMLGFARWNYEQGFFDYLNGMEQRRLENLSHQLIRYYVQAGEDFSGVDKQQLFETLIMMPHDTSRERRPALRENGQPRTQAHEGAPGTALYDADGNYVAGADLSVPSEFPMLKFDLMHEGKYIGYVGTRPSNALVSDIRSQMFGRQLSRSLMVGGAMFAIICVLSYFLSMLILRRVRKVIDAVHRLTSGQYEITLKSSSRDELAKLMRDVGQLAHVLQQARSSRKQWLANLTHDLRTPMTALMWEIQSVKDGVRDLDHERLHSIDQEVSYLNKFTNDIYELALSDIGGLSYEYKEMDLLQALLQSIDSTKGFAEEKSITIDLKPETAWISGDSNRLQQLFKNLLTNSIKYTDEGGKIQITMHHRDKTVDIIFEDTKPGVSPEACEKLFEPLYREDSARSRKQKGAGLGLSISQNIVEAHQGRILAMPSGLGGLKVTVELPALDS